MQELGQLLGQGTSGQVYRFGNDTVIKLFFPEIPPEKIGFEARITRHVNEAGLPAARVYDIIDYKGRTGIIYQDLEGKALLRILGHQVHRILYWADVLAKIHTGIHNCPPPKEIPTQKELFADWITAAQGLSSPVKDKVLRYLETMPDGNRLCHNDLHPDNIVMTKAGLIVIDWTCTRVGDPLADVANSMFVIQIGEVQSDTPGQNGIAIGRLAYSWLYARDYLKINGGKMADIARWRLPIAASRLIYKFPTEKQPCIDTVNREMKRLERKGLI
jgi:aminoglycoside phosphotransferase (APT) family kinase protein